MKFAPQRSQRIEGGHPYEANFSFPSPMPQDTDDGRGGGYDSTKPVQGRNFF